MNAELPHQYLERVVDLLDPAANQIYNMTVDEARACVLNGSPESVREIEGSFALVAREGRRVRLARSMDRPLRYFLAKRAEGPALIVADRIDAIHAWLKSEGFENQFHPSYTRMVRPETLLRPTPTFCLCSRRNWLQRKRLRAPSARDGLALISLSPAERGRGLLRSNGRVRGIRSCN